MRTAAPSEVASSPKRRRAAHSAGASVTPTPARSTRPPSSQASDRTSASRSATAVDERSAAAVLRFVASSQFVTSRPSARSGSGIVEHPSRRQHREGCDKRQRVQNRSKSPQVGRRAHAIGTTSSSVRKIPSSAARWVEPRQGAIARGHAPSCTDPSSVGPYCTIPPVNCIVRRRTIRPASSSVHAIVTSMGKRTSSKDRATVSSRLTHSKPTAEGRSDSATRTSKPGRLPAFVRRSVVAVPSTAARSMHRQAPSCRTRSQFTK